MTELDLIRTNHLIDPHLHIWGWEVPLYLFLGGLTAGIMILTALMVKRKDRSKAMRLLPLAAPLFLSLGMGALFLDLEQKLHVYRFYLAFRVTSPMSWGAWILLAIYPATLLLALASVTPADLKPLLAWLSERRPRCSLVLSNLQKFAQKRIPTIVNVNIGLGIALGFYTGILLGTLGARAAWNSALLGPLFLVSGLSAGAAFLMLFNLNTEEHGFLRRWDMVAIGIELALLALYFMHLVTGSAQGRHAAWLFFGGPLTAVFWAFVLVLGLFLPLGIEWLESRPGHDHEDDVEIKVSGAGSAGVAAVSAIAIRAKTVAPLLVLIGGFALRVILVKAGQS